MLSCSCREKFQFYNHDHLMETNMLCYGGPEVQLFWWVTAWLKVTCLSPISQWIVFYSSPLLLVWVGVGVGWGSWGVASKRDRSQGKYVGIKSVITRRSNDENNSNDNDNSNNNELTIMIIMTTIMIIKKIKMKIVI